MLESLENVGVLSSVRKNLLRRVSSISAQGELWEATQRRPALQGFEAPLEVVEYLQGTQHWQADQRSAVTAALIAEAQSCRHPLWCALLILSFFPHLCRLRGAIGRVTGIKPRELDQWVLSCFVSSVGRFPLATQGARAVVNLAMNSRKAVLQSIAKEQDWRDSTTELDESARQEVADEGPTPEEQLLAQDEAAARETAQEDFWTALEAGPEDQMLLILGTSFSNKPLIDWVREQHPLVSEPDFVRLYQRYRRRRSRLIQRLRQQVVSHSGAMAALLA